MKLPPDSGYSVSDETGLVHTRHPGLHAGPVRKTRTPEGVDSILAGVRPKLCRTCYPLPEKPLKTTRTAVQRHEATASMPRITGRTLRGTDPDYPVSPAYLPPERNSGQ